jgi:phenylpropionate dioxygenase-like ring-hydroxylating dioxygenase large terminal subunit
MRLARAAYHKEPSGAPDPYLTQVGRGTPCGEYMRRYWQPVAYLSELGDVPLRVRALGEDLVAFRDGSGNVGVMHLHCCHRNTSLEYGIIEEQGIRCCYHGRKFDIDGTVLEMPGEPAFERLRDRVSQGAYPTHVFAGIVFAYMGPPERVPVFPVFDRLDVPGVRLVPGVRFDYPCNWLQIRENGMDAYHTAVLHAIPQLRGMKHFAPEFEASPAITWADSPAGIMYLGARHVGENVWVRSAESGGANVSYINSIFERGDKRKYASLPFMTFWILPIDDEHSVRFYVSHVAADEELPFEERRRLEIFGQYEDRPYAERQWIPGDFDAQMSQGNINPHSREHLGAIDRGVVFFRRYSRQNIDAVARGEDPQGFYVRQDDVAPTFANDFVTSAAEIGGDPDDRDALIRFAEQLPARYRAAPPMRELAKGQVP